MSMEMVATVVCQFPLLHSAFSIKRWNQIIPSCHREEPRLDEMKIPLCALGRGETSCLFRS